MTKKIYLKNNLKTKIIIKNKYIVNYLENLTEKKIKIFCVVDKKVKYLITKSLHKKNINFIFLECGENIKNIKNYNKLCELLLSKHIDRESILIAIGGGTLGDLCGFVAGSILRGVSYRLIPTTLLSQVDSSIGGKNGINSKYGKNLIGLFYQPEEVIIDTKVLNTLSERELKSGYAEIIKHSLINDYKFFKWLDKNFKHLIKLKKNIIEEAIYKSIKIKLSYVENDTKEKLLNYKSRAMLNFGHTVGHSLEAFYGYKKNINHGEAISVGMITESIISNRLGFLPNNDLNKIITHFRNNNLKSFDKNIKNNKIIKNIINDKKNLHGKINIVLLKGIGKSFFKRDLKINKIEEIIRNI